MENRKPAHWILIVALVLYNFFFWGEQLGLNLVMFSSILLVAMIYLNPVSFTSSRVKLSVTGTLVSGAMVLFNNSIAAKFAHITSFFLTTAFIHQYELRSILYASTAAIIGQFESQLVIFKELSKISGVNKTASKGWRIAKLTIIPLAFLFLFYLLYAGANPKFNHFTADIFQNFFDLISNILKHISFARLSFLLLGLFLIAGVIYYSASRLVVNEESKMDDVLERKRMTRNKVGVRNSSGIAHSVKSYAHFKMTALKNEFKIGIIMLVATNLMLLVVNIIDVNWVWFNFHYEEGFNLSQFVHEGTYLLIASILLSIAILLFFFRQNLNFYSKNRSLKILGLIWMFQNLILVISVALRNIHYINYHGLAYKRIGVFFFLALTVFGIFTVAFKMLKVRSAYYLFRINSWAVYFAMIAIGMVNWDMVIARHNLNHNYPANVDVPFLMSLSDETLPLMYENKDRLKSEVLAYYNGDEYYWNWYQSELDHRRDQFLEKQTHHSWLSWNLQDQRVKDYFK